MPPSRTLILGAMPSEIVSIETELTRVARGELEGYPYVRGRLGSRAVVVSVTGVGITAAAMTSALFVHRFRPDELVSPAPGLVSTLGIVAWTTLVVKTGWRTAGYGTTEGLALAPALVDAAYANNLFVDGGFALEQGFIYSAMILAAMTVHILNRQFAKAAVWSLSAAALSTLGLMHAWRFTPGDTVVHIPLLELLSSDRAPSTLAEVVPAWEYALAYGVVSLLLLAAPWVTTPMEEEEP